MMKIGSDWTQGVDDDLAREIEPSHRNAARTVETALKVLGLFTFAHREWTIREVAEALGLHYMTAYRHVVTLEASDYLVRQPHGAYRLGLAVIEPAGVALSQLVVRVHGLAHVDVVAETTGCNTTLVVLYHGDTLSIATVMRAAAPRQSALLGKRSAAHCTAPGKVLLADLPFSAVRRLIERYGWRPYTPHSLHTFAALAQDFAEIKMRGYATDREERMLGAYGVAAPIRDAEGAAIAALGVSGPKAQLGGERLEELAAIVADQATTLSYRLGYADIQPRTAPTPLSPPLSDATTASKAQL